ncbi:ATP-binding protein [Lihuaxuella thermophila]|nr:sensor histidine kinase [Lihuaxuella thermophila]
MLIAVTLAGELNIHPFNDSFRISFSIPIFFFFLLWIRNISPIVSGLLVGISVVLFRMSLDVWHSGLPDESFRHHFPAFLYYFTYSCLFYATRINQYHHRPLMVGLLGVLIEITTGIVELSVRYASLLKVITGPTLGKIIVIAIIRTFFVLGFFNIIKLRQEEIVEQEQQKLMFISNLYEETIHLKKSLQNAEDITRDCYDLYRDLKTKHSADPDEFAQRALKIAGQVHEIKKDNQRIYAGISKMIAGEITTDVMKIEELGEVIVKTNQKYARLLGKEIQFVLQIEGAHPLYHVFTILTLINNLVANAVESIEKTGIIGISIEEKGDSVIFQVSDNGPGVPQKMQELIFKPGFTTKYDLLGKPSTGIGLSYVKEVVRSLEGEVSVQSPAGQNQTVFTIRLPLDRLIRKG